MRNTVKLVMIIGLVLTSFNISAQTKAEKNRLKIKKFNDALLIENKAPLLDGVHQTKAFFATTNNLSSTKDIVTEFTLDDLSDLYLNIVFEDEIQNYLINLATESGVKFKTFSQYSGGVKKVNCFRKMRMKFEILVDGKSVFSDNHMSATSVDHLFISSSKDESFYVHELKTWFRRNQNYFMKDCKIQGVYTFYMENSNINFVTEEEKAFFKNKLEISVKTDILNYKYDKDTTTKYFLKVLGNRFNYYDFEAENEELVQEAFSNYKKKNGIKSENIVEVIKIMGEWEKIRYSNIDAIKGRGADVIIFFKDKGTENYRCLTFRLYQEKLYDDNYGEVNVYNATEKPIEGLSFLNSHKKQIALFLKSHTLESAL